MRSSVDYRYCSACNRKQLFETPECVDGHGADCPDRACVECGTALYVDLVIVGVANRRAKSPAA
jgi:deoxyinosine 3'endonuclease (endonuclease V)